MVISDLKKLQSYSDLAITQRYQPVDEANKIVRKHDYEMAIKVLPMLGILMQIHDDCSEFGWDGDNALPVSESSFRNALIFLLKTPLDFEAPVPGVCANGQITLEWRREDRRLLSLAFDDNGGVSYIAFLLNGERSWGEQKALLGYTKSIKSFLEEVFK